MNYVVFDIDYVTSAKFVFFFKLVLTATAIVPMINPFVLNLVMTKL